MKFKAVVIGVSSGGLKALRELFSGLPAAFVLPVIVVQHVSPRSDNEWVALYSDSLKRQIKEAEEKESIKPGIIYVAPPNYHLLIETDKTFTLTTSERVNFARPSIDVLFESAAYAYRNALIGVVLTGANADGAKGLKQIKDANGLTIVQDPATAEAPQMPTAAISAASPDHILSIPEIAGLLTELS